MRLICRVRDACEPLAPLAVRYAEDCILTSTDDQMRFSPSTTDRLCADVLPAVTWDGTTRTLLCISHPLGRGSFYYGWSDRDLVIASNLHDLAHETGFTSLDVDVVAEYFLTKRRISVTSATFLQGLREVPAGHFLSWGRGAVTVERYWTPHDTDRRDLRIEEAASHVREAIRVSLERERGSMVCLLSGGLDSSVVAALAARGVPSERLSLLLLQGDLVSAEEERLQETVAAHLDLRRYSYHPPARLDLDALHALNREAPAPAGGMFTGMYADVLSWAHAHGFDVLAGGEGGDEVFEPHPYIIADHLRARRWRAAAAAAVYFGSANSGNTATRALLDYGLRPLRGRVHTRRSPFLDALLGPFAASLSEAAVRLSRHMNTQRDHRWSYRLHESFADVLDLPFYEPRPVRDSANVRVVSPLASLPVIEAAARLRPDEWLSNDVGMQSKRLLRAVAAGLLPATVRSAPKIGITDLIQRMSRGQEENLRDYLMSGILPAIGVTPDAHLADPRNVPADLALYWSFLLILTIWYEELRQCKTRAMNEFSTWHTTSLGSLEDASFSTSTAAATFDWPSCRRAFFAH
jgi:asparagine synthetase B (glutamine-hydrolysing)